MSHVTMNMPQRRARSPPNARRPPLGPAAPRAPRSPLYWRAPTPRSGVCVRSDLHVLSVSEGASQIRKGHSGRAGRRVHGKQN